MYLPDMHEAVIHAVKLDLAPRNPATVFSVDDAGGWGVQEGQDCLWHVPR